jgi:uncharacterized protein YndB with AHSA1/START domain
MDKRTILFVAVLPGCAAQQLPLPQSPSAWPAQMKPADCPVYVRNEIDIDAPPERVWRWLVRADRWSEWFKRASKVHVDGDPSLAPGTQVAFRMLGAAIRVTVRRAEPGRALEWEGGASGVHAYHTWWLVPLPDGRTHLVTEETERGPVPSLMRYYLRGALHRAHQDWVVGLAHVATSGEP